MLDNLTIYIMCMDTFSLRIAPPATLQSHRSGLHDYGTAIFWAPGGLIRLDLACHKTNECLPLATGLVAKFAFDSLDGTTLGPGSTIQYELLDPSSFPSAACLHVNQIGGWQCTRSTTSIVHSTQNQVLRLLHFQP